MPGSLEIIYYSISSKKREDLIFWIPELWMTENETAIMEKKQKQIRVEPYSFLTSQIKKILSLNNKNYNYNSSLSSLKEYKFDSDRIIDGKIRRKPGDWLIGASIYGINLRNFSAYDHDQDGKIGHGSCDDITINSQGIRETGTFIKTAAILPYIKSMGFNTICLTPVMLTGKAYKSGELGSPYSIKNPFKLDNIYHDPFINEIPIEMEWKALIEACHMMDLRIILDFTLKTASRDSDFIPEHPDWFYWIDNTAILNDDSKFNNQKSNSDKLSKKRYTHFFVNPPENKDIIFENESTGYFIKFQNKKAIIPEANSIMDKISDLSNDITFFKLTDEINEIPSINSKYVKKSIDINTNLWKTLAGIVPYYQKEYGIDGAKFNQNGFLPPGLMKMVINNIRNTDPDFGLISENFEPDKKNRENGYNLSSGNYQINLFKINQSNKKHQNQLKTFINNLTNVQCPALGAPETLDSPRAAVRRGGIKFSLASWILVNTLPNTVPFCNSGFELGEKNPDSLNSGFSIEEKESMIRKKLGLYDATALNWDSISADELIGLIIKINKFRQENIGIITHIDNFYLLDSEVDGELTLSPENPVIAYLRAFRDEIINYMATGIFGEILYPIEVENDYLIVVNMDFENERIVSIKMCGDMAFNNIFKAEELKTVNQELNLKLKPGEFIIAASIYK